MFYLQIMQWWNVSKYKKKQTHKQYITPLKVVSYPVLYWVFDIAYYLTGVQVVVSNTQVFHTTSKTKPFKHLLT